MHESPPLASERIVRFRSSNRRFKRLSRSGPYGMSRGYLSGGRRNVTFIMHASLIFGSSLVCLTTSSDHFWGASWFPRDFILQYGTPLIVRLMYNIDASGVRENKSGLR